MQEKLLYRWNKPDRPIDRLVLDPFDSPWQPGTETPMADLDTALGFTDQMSQLEVTLLQRALDQNDRHQGRAAESLGLTYHQFRNLLRKHNLTKKG